MPIECDRFEAKNQCQYCKHWSYIDRCYGQCVLLEHKTTRGFFCAGFETDWISAKDKLPELGARIKVKHISGVVLSGVVENRLTYFDDKEILFDVKFSGETGRYSFTHWKLSETPKGERCCLNCKNGIGRWCPFLDDCARDGIDGHWQPLAEKPKEKRCCYNCKNEVAGGLCQFFQDCDNLDYWKPIPEKEKEEKGCKNCEKGASLWCPYLEGCIHNGIEVYWKPIPEKEKEERADFFFASRSKGDNFLSLWYGEKEYQFPTCGGWNSRVNLMRLLDWLNECLSTRDIE